MLKGFFKSLQPLLSKNLDGFPQNLPKSCRSRIKSLDFFELFFFCFWFCFGFLVSVCVYDDGLVCFCVVVRVWRFKALVISGLSREGCLCVFLLCFLLSKSRSLIVPLFVCD